MTIEEAHQLADWLNDNGSEVSVMEEYSGRGMYGATVPALVFEYGPDQVALGYAGSELGLPLEDLPQRRDSMGLGTVIY